MSLRKNIVASYASQIYVLLIGIVMLPMYIKLMGAEAYGLIGFFTMLQALFNLLDMGLTPTMARETARFNGGALSALIYRQFVRAVEGVFLFVALVGAGFLFIASEYIASSWLKSSVLLSEDIQDAIQLMAIIIAMRWMSGLYRGAISGFEKLVWLGGYNAFIATIRFIAVLPILIFIDASPATFFSFQLGVAVLEMTGLVFYSYWNFPPVPNGIRIAWSWSAIKPTLKFSLMIAFLSLVWVLTTQIDKLILSKILPLAEYGHFTLAVLAASGVIVISGPVSSAIMPRMAKLEAEGDHIQLISVYRKSTQLVAVIAGSASVTLLFYAEPLLWAWTGSELLAKKASPILALYGIGNGILAVSAFPYYLQYAKGDLRLHLIGSAIFLIILIPLVMWAASQFGGVGAGYAWLAMNLATFIIWLPFVHRKFEPGLNWLWYTEDTVIIFLSALIVGYCLSTNLPILNGRVAVVFEVMIVGMLIMLGSVLASSRARKIGMDWIQSHRVNYK